MRHIDYDPDLLQRLRLEIAAQRTGPPRLDGFADVDPERLQAHIERLLYGGELDAAARVTGDGLDLEVCGLTPYGVLAMHARLSKRIAGRDA